MTDIATVFDERACELGEGPLWHPLRKQLFWFDILGHRLLSRVDGQALEWQFSECHSAAGWIDTDTLLIASETGLWRFDIGTGHRDLICELEANNPDTRSNDGRADPKGGFWIGTMGKRAEAGYGAIYRYYRGELRKLWSGLSIPNSICFSLDGSTGYFTDTQQGRISKQPLDHEGWPKGEPGVFADPGSEGFNPDGSVVDAQGGLWNAQWGAGRVVRYSQDGEVDRIIKVAGLHSSCPAFGGPNMQTLFVTTAFEGIANPNPAQGCVYQVPVEQSGVPEHAVRC